MTIRAVIFDFGGVLLRWNPRKLFESFFVNQTEAIDQFIEEIRFTEWNVEQDKGRPFNEGIAELSNRFPPYTHIFQAFHEKWLDSIDGEIHGCVELLYPLKSRGYSLCGLSNWSAETFPAVRQQYNFFGLFDTIIISGEIKLVKPDPAIFQYCLHTIDRSAEECLFIDDSESNILAAKKIGFETIHFSTSEQLRAELRHRRML